MSMKKMKKMTTKNQIRISIAAVLLSSSLTLAAQEKETKLNREMTLEREYDPSVQDANKVNRLPDLKEPKEPKHTIEYSPFTLPADPEKEIVVLPSGKIMTAIPYNKRRGYLRLGTGMNMNVEGDFGYHLLNNRTDFLNVFFSHRSTSSKLKDYDGSSMKQKAKLNDNLGGIHFHHHFDFGTLRLGGKYGYTGFNYYGFPLDSLYRIQQPSNNLLLPQSYPADREKNQVNQTMNAYVGIRSKEDALLGYLLNIEYQRFGQKYGHTVDVDGIRENRFTLQLGFSSRFSNNTQRVGLAGKLDYFNYTYPSNNKGGDTLAFGYQNHAQITVTPYYRYADDNWKLQLGANVMLITGDSSKLFLSPNISAEGKIADKTVLYLYAGGGIGMNDARSISQLNRYTDHGLMVKPSRTWLDLELGIRSGFVPNMWMEFFGGYKITENEVFFVPANYVGAKHDFGNYSFAYQPDASLFRVGASLKYAYQKWVDASIKGVYHNWSLRDGDGNTWLSGKGNGYKRAYGRPELELHADLTVRPFRPLTLALGYYLGANRYTLFHQKEIKLSNINDLNLTATYNFNDTFGAYVKVNNMLNSQQELWYAYPTQQFHVLAGVNLNF